MALKKLVIAHLYPAEMNIYGDRGNVIALQKRLAWRKIGSEVIVIEPGVKFDFKRADIIFGGGGQDRGQNVVAADLQARKANLHAAAKDGVVMLTICGTYQLFGHGFKTKDGELIPGISLFKMQTVGSDVRMIGNLVIKTQFGELVGFENHSGQTELEETQEAFGSVSKGFGNNDHSKLEGAVFNNVFGSYMHGPLLPKNPEFADELIKRALLRKFGSAELAALDDSIEHQAARVAMTRPQ